MAFTSKGTVISLTPVVSSIVAALFVTAPLQADTFIHRDLETRIYGDEANFVSSRNMRHIWATGHEDPASRVTAVVVKKEGNEDRGMVLYRSADDGTTWDDVLEISKESYLVSDGIIDTADNIHLVYSTLRRTDFADVRYARLTFMPAPTESWSFDPDSIVTVFPDGERIHANRATIAMDAHDVLWCAFRFEDSSERAGECYIKVYYSIDNGKSWQDSGQDFGRKNDQTQKTPTIFAFGDGFESRIGLVYQDVDDEGGRHKWWAFRDDDQDPEEPWQGPALIARMEMPAPDGDPFGSHWSVAGDGSGNVHLAFQDYGINYVKYDPVDGQWGEIAIMARTGIYSNITVSSSDNVYLLRDRGVEYIYGKSRIVGKKYSTRFQAWLPPERWQDVSVDDYGGKLRMCMPERFDRYLPVLYQVDSEGEHAEYGAYHLLFSLIYSAD